MDFSNERYVRYYVRETTTWKVLPFESQALLPQMLRLVDRSGVLELGGVDPVAAVWAALPKWPRPLIESGLTGLLERGVILHSGDTIVWPRFLEAQESSQTDRLRQAESRAKRREIAMSVTNRDAGVTKRDKMSQLVTACHTVSHDVTPAVLAEPAVPEEKKIGSEPKRNGSSPAIHPDIVSWLLKTRNLKPLADPQYGSYWESLERAYDSYDWLYFEREINKADSWIEANRHRRPTDRGLTRFMRSWLEKAVDFGRRRQGA